MTALAPRAITIRGTGTVHSSRQMRWQPEILECLRSHSPRVLWTSYMPSTPMGRTGLCVRPELELLEPGKRGLTLVLKLDRTSATGRVSRVENSKQICACRITH